MVGFFGLSRASAAAWTLLAPWCCTGWGSGETASGCECSDDALDEGADGEPAGLPAVPGVVVVFAGAAMVPALERGGSKRGAQPMAIWRLKRHGTRGHSALVVAENGSQHRVPPPVLRRGENRSMGGRETRGEGEGVATRA